jgi:exodeoxyribonuclease VII small subunit
MSKNDEVNFSEKFSELEAIVEWFDGDVKDVDESLKKFERGVELSKELKDYLKNAENKVKKIKADFELG